LGLTNFLFTEKESWTKKNDVSLFKKSLAKKISLIRLLLLTGGEAVAAERADGAKRTG
jgi:hypothetical protein